MVVVSCCIPLLHPISHYYPMMIPQYGSADYIPLLHIVTSQSFLGHESWSIHIWRFQKINGRYLQIIHVNFVLSIINHPSLGTPWLWKPTCIYIYMVPLLLLYTVYDIWYHCYIHIYIYHIPYHIYSIHNIYIIYITYIYSRIYRIYIIYNIHNIYNIHYIYNRHNKYIYNNIYII